MGTRPFPERRYDENYIYTFHVLVLGRMVFNDRMCNDSEGRYYYISLCKTGRADR